MGALGDLYAKLEDKYYDFLDSLDKAGIPVYKVLDAVEGANIPTFPIAVILGLVIIGAIIFVASGMLLPSQSTLTVVALDSSGASIINAPVTLELSGGNLSGTTNNSGEAEFRVPKNEEFTIAVSKEPDFAEKTQKFTAVADAETATITLARKSTTVSKTVNLLVEGSSNQLVNKEVSVSFLCSAATYSETRTTSNGTISIQVPNDCGTLYATPGNGFTSTSSAGFNVTGTSPIEIFLSEEPQGKGNIIVSVADSSGAAQEG